MSLFDVDVVLFHESISELYRWFRSMMRNTWGVLRLGGHEAIMISLHLGKQRSLLTQDQQHRINFINPP